ncbi:MAG: histidinol-phosphate transaminase [Bacteroidaceae bacterium]|nr:histidinol-phosphate transaminase [Bacteroidaceae bacterium]
MKDLKNLVRPNIWSLKPYSSARDEYKGMTAEVFLDANENPYNRPINRYPDPLQEKLKAAISPIKGVPAENIFLGNGSDEAIDLVYRVFCNPGKDNVVAIDPTYGMYQVCADINDVEYRKVTLDEHFQFRADDLLAACDDSTKVIFLCSPNNPSGNCLLRSEIETVLEKFDGIVVVDEAYSDFAEQRPFRMDLQKYPNIVVLNTFSKAFGAAAIRLGMAFASVDIIGLFNKVKYPYNVNKLTQDCAMEELKDVTKIHQRIVQIKDARTMLMQAFSELPICQKVYPTDANFFLARVTDANAIYDYLVHRGIIVRNRNRVTLCGNCLRITIGTKDENTRLLSALRQYR